MPTSILRRLPSLLVLLISSLLALPYIKTALASDASSSSSVFLSLNHISRECNNCEVMADFYTSLLGFSRVPAPPFPFGVVWLSHPSGLTMHLIESTAEYRLAEGPARDASSGRSKNTFTQGKFDPIHIRRGHHLAWNVKDLEPVKRALEAMGIPFGLSQVPGTDTKQLFAFDPEGNGLECVYKAPPKEEL